VRRRRPRGWLAAGLPLTLVSEHSFVYRGRVGADLIPIRDDDGTTVWISHPPAACPNEHPFTPGDVTAYAENWYACWCDAAQDDGGRSGHTTFTCKICATVVLDPPCTNPNAKVGWGAAHSH
jgi:hypothetical protein